ncbi:MAG: glycosyltransferase [Gemmatimonadetes bacterium]|nr:glycosyltransferase [Gemmatimonadota bacterium]
MRVALNAARLAEGFASLDHVSAIFQELLGARCELVLFPDDYYTIPPTRRVKAAEELVRGCDVVLTQPDATLMATRARLNAPIPVCMLVLGSLPRGFFGLGGVVSAMRTSDVLVANCTADLAIAARLFENANARLLPFAYREEFFYPPPPEEAAALRNRLGLPSRAPLVLYSGRCTLEKNIHAVLKVFSVVLAAVPDAHLVLAGPVSDTPFYEFGVFPLDLPLVVQRMIGRLGLQKRVHHAGPLAPHDLRAAYGAADVVLNLTLNQDENFGLSPVEAMACGTPVVGTRWGGLQDTVAHGQAGFQVSTALTAHGVKSAWWEAANRVVELLRDPGRRAEMGRRGTEIARERFSPARHGDLLMEILEDAVQGSRRMREPLRVSAFTRDLWETCRPAAEPTPLARRGDAAYALYRQLVAPYAGTADGGVAPGEPVSGEQVVFLVNPVTWNDDGTLAVNDPQFPFDVEIPSDLDDAVRAALDGLLQSPVTTAGTLMEAAPDPGVACRALAWMLEAGLLLRARPALDAIDPAAAREAALTPLVTIHRVREPADIVYLG